MSKSEHQPNLGPRDYRVLLPIPSLGLQSDDGVSFDVLTGLGVAVGKRGDAWKSWRLSVADVRALDQEFPHHLWRLAPPRRPQFAVSSGGGKPSRKRKPPRLEVIYGS